jgi:hypothetical protein
MRSHSEEKVQTNHLQPKGRDHSRKEHLKWWTRISTAIHSHHLSQAM